MNTGTVILGISIALPFAVSTMPSLAQNPAQSSSQVNFERLAGPPVELVNIISQKDSNGVPHKIDPRWPLTVLGPKLGMSLDEINTARKTTGYVVCPGREFNNPGQGSAVIVGQGDYILTNVHIFIDETDRRREPLSECYFQNQTVPYERIPLEFRKGGFKFFTDNPYGTFYNDLAVVRLKKRIAGVTPFQFDPTGVPIREDEKMLVISSMQDRLTRPTDPHEPIAQSCSAIKVFDVNDRHPTAIYSDCSSTHGASGSVGLVRIDGRLVIKAIISGLGDDDADYLPFDIKQKSFTHHVGIDLEVLREIEALMRESPGSAVKANAPTPIKKKPDDALPEMRQPVAEQGGPFHQHGLTLSDFTDDLHHKYKFDDSVKGVIVTAVSPGSLADKRHLVIGEVITAAAQEQVTDTAALNAKIGQLKASGRTSILLYITNDKRENHFVALPLE